MKSTLALAVALLLSAVLVAPTNGVAAGASTPSLSSELSKQPPHPIEEIHAKKRYEVLLRYVARRTRQCAQG